MPPALNRIRVALVVLVLVLVLGVVLKNESHNPNNHRDARFNLLRFPISERRRSTTLAALLGTVTRVLSAARVGPADWWLDGGTLLGAVRDSSGYIPWDLDVDIAVTTVAYHKLRDSPATIVPPGYALEVHGSATHPDGGRRDGGLVARLIDIQTGCYVDLIHYVETCGSTQLQRSPAPAAEPVADCRVTWPVWMSIGACHDCLGRKADSRGKPSLERPWVFPLSDCAIRGVPLKCPARPPDYLAHFYGPSWSTAHSPPRRATGLYFDLLDTML